MFVALGHPRSGAISKADGYRLTGDNKIAPDSFLECTRCNRTHSIKNDAAIAAELAWISAYLETPAEPSCSTASCPNAGAGIYSRPEAWSRFQQRRMRPYP